MEELPTLDSVQEYLSNSRKEKSPIPVGGPTEDPEEIRRRLDVACLVRCIKCDELYGEKVYPTETMARADRPWTRLRHICSKCHKVEDEEAERKALVILDQRRVDVFIEWQEQSNIPPRYWYKTFETFERDRQPHAYDLTLRYYDLPGRDENPDQKSLFLSSNGNGTGKTHLACALGLRWMQDSLKSWRGDWQPACPVLFTTATDLFLRIRNTYKDDPKESEQEVLDHIANVDLLILDDVGKEKPSDHKRETYYTIVNTRYNTNAPMVITSNLTVPKQAKQLALLIGDAAMSRLKEMTEGWRVVMEGKDYRYEVKT